jgi:uncharacterized protein (DUF2249 family)
MIINETVTNGLTIDVRSLMPSYRHPVIFTILKKLPEMGAPRDLRVVTDHEPVGLRMELEMSKEIQGHYRVRTAYREGKAWLARIEWREEMEE